MFCHGNSAFHDYEGIALNLEERERLTRDLGDKAVMILRNHGTLVAGRSICEAFVTMFLLEKAARAQLRAMACSSKLVSAAPEAVGITAQFGRSGSRRAQNSAAPRVRPPDPREPSYQTS